MRVRLAAVLFCVSCADPDVASELRAPTGDVTLAARAVVRPEASPTARMSKPTPPTMLPKRTLPLPPISGGTLRVTANGATVVAADPENDVVWFVDVASQEVSSVPLQPGDDPGRLAEDAAGRIHVVLRRGGAIVTMSAGTAPGLLQRRAVCAEPRGVAYRAADDALLVACTDGQLLRLPAASGDATLIKQLPDDLRDVVISGTDIIISRFRSAELLTLDPGGTVRTDALLPHVSASQTPPQSASSAVAWRMLALPSGGVLVAHQLELTTAVVTAPSQPAAPSTAWGGPVVAPDLLGPVTSTVSTFGGPNGESDVFLSGGLPVDIALSSNGWFAAITAADGALTTSRLTGLTHAGAGAISTVPGTLSGFQELGQPVAVAFMPNQYTVVQLRAPAGIVIGIDDFIPFPAPDQSDVGHTLFHTQTPSALACASCHPEGHDDGHVWQFTAGELRRTQDVSGGVLATAPLHWDGAFNDMSSLLDDVFVGRMGAASPSSQQRIALASWLDSIPRPAVRPAQNALAVQRGQLLFESLDVGCTTCHSGPRFTNNLTLDVGTGRPFQVPSLTGLAARAPYLHDGCASTLEERFTCGGGDAHGHTSQLTAQQVSDLVSYLKTL
jgi:hypothetical protein